MGTHQNEELDALMAQLADETASQIISRVEQNLDIGLAMQVKNVADRLIR